MKRAETLKEIATTVIVKVAEDFYLDVLGIVREQAENGWTETDIEIPSELISARPFSTVEPECKVIMRRLKYDGFRVKIRRADEYSNDFVVNVRWR